MDIFIFIEGEEVDGKWQGTNGNCRRGFNLAAVIFKDGAGKDLFYSVFCVTTD